MDEDQFRKTYKELNLQRCVFEKAINSRRCGCCYKQTFLLANREGVKCEAPQGAALCTSVLDHIRQASRFSLKLLTVDAPLPHNQELRVQAGGIQQLKQLTDDSNAATTNDVDIHSTIQRALAIWQDVERLPYQQLVAGIANYQIRSRRNKDS